MLAPAKINLDLLITGRRADGYHLLDSLVAFTEFGDELVACESQGLTLEIKGPFAKELKVNQDNLILKAARAICKKTGIIPNIKFTLIKNLPVSSGIGGGSADAAAALKLCIDFFSLDLNDTKLNEIALKLGADVPVCLRSSTSHMSGVGEKMIGVKLISNMHVLLVNPGLSISTPTVFAAYKNSVEIFDEARSFLNNQMHLPLMIDTLKKSRNSLQGPATSLEPRIKDVLTVLKNIDNIFLSRMSGSGATCFALFQNEKDCKRAEEIIAMEKPNWWVKATKFL